MDRSRNTRHQEHPWLIFSIINNHKNNKTINSQSEAHVNTIALIILVQCATIILPHNANPTYITIATRGKSKGIAFSVD